MLETGDYMLPGNEVMDDQVCNDQPNLNNTDNAGLAHIEPVLAMILSLTDKHSKPIHIELDNGATCSYIV